MCMKVDLPDPDGPTTETNSPAAMSSVIPRRACTDTSPTRYTLASSRTAITPLTGGQVRPASVRRRRLRLPAQRGEVIEDGRVRLLGSGVAVDLAGAFDDHVLVGGVRVAAVAGPAHADRHRHLRDFLAGLLVRE